MREAQHLEPVWSDRADFVIAVELEDEDEVSSEQLRVREVAPYTFELCCIPFFAFDLALGDVVETDAEYMVRRVVSPSGRYVFRVWFGSTAHPRDRIADELSGLGALLEWSSLNLLALDARDQEHAVEIAGYLAGAEDRGELMYETGRS